MTAASFPVALAWVSEPDGVAPREYWHACRCDDLPPGVDLSVFDCAMASGPRLAVQWLQYAVCGLPDGVFTADTLLAVQHADAEAVVMSLAALRGAYYRRIVANDPAKADELPGWLSRAQLTKVKALTMTGTSHV